MQVAVRGLSFSLDDAGQGEPLVLVHGFPLDRRMWHAQTVGLAGVCRVIASDLRGFGGSSPPPAVMTMDDYAADLASLLDALDVAGPVTLAGLSMGGYVAFAFARRYPDRLGRLILCDTKAAADPPEKRADRERIADEVLRDGTGRLAEDMPSQLLAGRTLAERPEVADAVRGMIADAPPAAVAAAQRGMAARSDATELLPKIGVPTLVLCGEEDRISPPGEMRAIADRLPNATFVTIPGAGHLAPLEAPDAVNDSLRRFLAGT